MLGKMWSNRNSLFLGRLGGAVVKRLPSAQGIYPPGQPMINFTEASLMMAVKVVTMTMMVALQLALPMMASLLLVDLALGFLAKSAPQFNIFAIGFSFKLIAGFAVMVLLMGLTLTGISQFIPLLQEVMHDFMLILGDAS